MLTQASILIVLLASLVTAHADDLSDGSSKSSMKLEDTKQDKNSVPGDVDEIITNKKMRAESGSKSRWSIGSTLIYSGGTIETPLAEKRPNLAGGAGNTLVSSFGGTVGVGYKVTSTDRLGLDVGVRWLTPLFKSTPANHSKVDAYNPSLLYSKAYKMMGIQSVLQTGPTVYTATNNTNYGYQFGYTVQQVNAYEFGHSGFTIGLVLGADYNTFNKFDLISKANSSDYDFMVSPFMEYVLSDTFNLRTVFNYGAWEHDRDSNVLLHNENVQSVGLGISVTRDIFLYPNLQFVPYNITHVFRADTTNVALQANINVF